jgi:signal transduction histidine kinase
VPAIARPTVVLARSPSLRQVAVCAAAVAVGLGAERVAFGWRDPLHWVPDLLVGWTFVASGLVASSRFPESRTGRLLTATGFAWFAANFESLGWAPAAWLAGQAAFLHRGLVIHALVTFPTGRLRSRAARAAVGVGYAASFAPLAGSDFVAMVSGAVVIGSGLALLGRSRGRVRRVRGPTIAGALVFGGALSIAAAVRMALPAGEGDDVMLLAYEAALCVVALELAAGIAERAGERAGVADLVVELGEAGSGSLGHGLARALGDPSLEIGYWLPERERFVDVAGRELRLPRDHPAATVTMVERAGRRVAAIVHDPAVLDDPTLVTAVSSAARLAAANARLQAEVANQLHELHASRRRLVEAGDEERRRLERRLHDGVERQLTALSGALERARSLGGRGPPAGAALEHVSGAQEQLARSLAELGELARGLHPRVLTEEGLAGALEQLAAASELDVDVAVADVRLAPAVAVAAYFVCAEALANAAKYASASRAWVDVRSADRRLTVSVRDDGVGGAHAHTGGGLSGLADRVHAHGGTLRIDSPRGRGTLLVAELPSIAGDGR